MNINMDEEEFAFTYNLDMLKDIKDFDIGSLAQNCIHFLRSGLETNGILNELKSRENLIIQPTTIVFHGMTSLDICNKYIAELYTRDKYLREYKSAIDEAEKIKFKVLYIKAKQNSHEYLTALLQI